MYVYTYVNLYSTMTKVKKDTNQVADMKVWPNNKLGKVFFIYGTWAMGPTNRFIVVLVCYSLIMNKVSLT